MTGLTYTSSFVKDYFRFDIHVVIDKWSFSLSSQC